MSSNFARSIIVTGGAGYVGSTLMRYLLRAGYQVTCLDKLMYGGESLFDLWDHPNFFFEKCDIMNHDHVSDLLIEADYFAVIHLAAIVGDPACRREPELARATNWDASVHLLNKSIERQVPRFIFASTCSNYGKMQDFEDYVDENSALAPVSLYANLKVNFEQLLLNRKNRFNEFCPTALRFATVYGFSHRMRFDLTVNEFTKELTLGKELVVFGEQFWRPYCHVKDFARAMLAVLDAPTEIVAYECFNVGSTEENYTKGMIVDELLRLFPNAKIRRVDKQEDPRDYKVSFEKIKNILGFNVSRNVPVGIREIKKVVESGIIQNPQDQKYYNIPHNSE